MAAIATALLSNVFGSSEAEKALTPWWDKFEDYCIYGLVMLGVIAFPTAMYHGSPFQCTFCTKDLCPAHITDKMNDTKDPGLGWFPPKYCNEFRVNNIVLFFPFVVLVVPLIILMIEQIFSILFHSGHKLDAFYKLVNEATKSEKDVNTTKVNEKTESGEKPGSDDDSQKDNSKLAVEVTQSFYQSSRYYYSYVFSTITQFLVAFGLFIFIIFHGLPAIQQEEKVYCQIEDSKYYYFCAGHPQKFYIVLCYMTLVFLALYLALTIFNLLWLIIIPMRPLTQAMKLFKDEFKIFDTDSIDDLYDLYYNNYDLQLLLDLLASKSGITPCLKLLSILDKNLLEMTKASNAIVETVNDSESIDAIVTFDDAPIVKEVFAKVLDLKSIYSVEISPPIKTDPIHMVKCVDLISKSNTNQNIEMPEMKPLFKRMEVKFKDLQSDVEYTISICTFINGKSISKRQITLKKQEN